MLCVNEVDMADPWTLGLDAVSEESSSIACFLRGAKDVVAASEFEFAVQAFSLNRIFQRIDLLKHKCDKLFCFLKTVLFYQMLDRRRFDLGVTLQ